MENFNDLTKDISKNKQNKSILDIDINFDTRKALNRAENVIIPADLVERIEDRGITVEELDSLDVPIFKYKTQVTIHGIFKGDLERGRVGGYKSLLLNQNKSLGVRYNAIDIEKKNKIAYCLSIYKQSIKRGLISQPNYFFRIMQDSTGYYLNMSSEYLTKDNYPEIKQRFSEIVNNIPDVYFGTKGLQAFNIFGSYVLYLTIRLNAIYEKNIYIFISFITNGAISNEQDLQGYTNKIKQIEAEEDAEKERQKQEAKQEQLKEFNEIYKPKIDELIKTSPLQMMTKTPDFKDMTFIKFCSILKTENGKGNIYVFEFEKNRGKFYKKNYKPINEWKDINNLEEAKNIYSSKSTVNINDIAKALDEAILKDIKAFFLIEAKYDNGKYIKPKNTTTPTSRTQGLITRYNSAKIDIVDYSEKAVAVFGETILIKERLSELGGRFNKYLFNSLKGVKEAGWIFSKTKKQILIDEFIESNETPKEIAKNMAEFNNDVYITDIELTEYDLPFATDELTDYSYLQDIEFISKPQTSEAKMQTNKKSEIKELNQYKEIFITKNTSLKTIIKPLIDLFISADIIANKNKNTDSIDLYYNDSYHNLFKGLKEYFTLDRMYPNQKDDALLVTSNKKLGQIALEIIKFIKQPETQTSEVKSETTERKEKLIFVRLKEDYWGSQKNSFGIIKSKISPTSSTVYFGENITNNIPNSYLEFLDEKWWNLELKKEKGVEKIVATPKIMRNEFIDDLHPLDLWKQFADGRWYRKFEFKKEDTKNGKWREIIDLGIREILIDRDYGLEATISVGSIPETRQINELYMELFPIEDMILQQPETQTLKQKYMNAFEKIKQLDVSKIEDTELRNITNLTIEKFDPEVTDMLEQRLETLESLYSTIAENYPQATPDYVEPIIEPEIDEKAEWKDAIETLKELISDKMGGKNEIAEWKDAIETLEILISEN